MEQIIASLTHYATTLYTLINWRDMIEIAIISLFFYYSALWLKKDPDKNLLAYFYSYLLLMIAAHSLQLTTLSSLLFVSSPVVALLFMFMHQQMLQRNFVSLKNITLATKASSPDWLSSIMKATLTMLTHNKDIILLIEHTDAVSPYLHIPEAIDVPITDGIITVLFNHVYRPEYLCWISSSGMVRGINVSFKASWHPSAYQTKTAWMDDAVAYTAKTDAIILVAQADQHHYIVAHNGTIIPGLMMEQAQKLIKKLIKYQVPLPKKGYSHGVTNQKNIAHHSP